MSTPPFVITPTASTTTAVDNNIMDIVSESEEGTARRRQAQVDAQMASLPLGWTRVVPRSKRGRNGNDCCNIGPSCRHRRRSRLSSSANASSTAMNSDGGLLGTTTTTSASTRRSRGVSGRVIFCLHESNPDWFQGYFFPNIVGGGHAAAPSPSSSWGLLAVQKVLDECLQCSEGGYRVIDLTVTMGSKEKKKKKVKLMDIEWTGGDMMDLKGINEDTIEMQTDRLVTGQAATSSMERFFGGLLRTLRAADTDLKDLPVLSLLPDAAIVTGSMTLYLPIEPEEEEADTKMMMTMLDQD